MDLFDIVRAAAPPRTVREPVKTREDGSSSPAEVKVSDSDEDSDSDTMPFLNGTKRRNQPDGDPFEDCHDDEQLIMTKAQQRSLIEGQVQGLIKPCFVRIKRLLPTDIEHFTAAAENGHKADSTKKPKLTRKSIKPLVNGNKQSKPVQSSMESAKLIAAPGGGGIQTCEPVQSPVIPSGDGNSELIERYGKRFFQCVVKVKRLKDSTNNVVPPTSNRKSKSKSKLSISFNESVKILGSDSSQSTILLNAPKSRSSLRNGGHNDASTASSSARSKRSRSGLCNGG